MSAKGNITVMMEGDELLVKVSVSVGLRVRIRAKRKSEGDQDDEGAGREGARVVRVRGGT